MVSSALAVLDGAANAGAANAGAAISRVAGALAVAVFGALLSNPDTFVHGAHTSLLIAAVVLALATTLALFLPTTKEHS